MNDQSWASQEFGAAHLGDVRRKRRLLWTAAKLAAEPAGRVTIGSLPSISQAGLPAVGGNYPAVSSSGGSLPMPVVGSGLPVFLKSKVMQPEMH